MTGPRFQGRRRIIGDVCVPMGAVTRFRSLACSLVAIPPLARVKRPEGIPDKCKICSAPANNPTIAVPRPTGCHRYLICRYTGRSLPHGNPWARVKWLPTRFRPALAARVFLISRFDRKFEFVPSVRLAPRDFPLLCSLLFFPLLFPLFFSPFSLFAGNFGETMANEMWNIMIGIFVRLFARTRVNSRTRLNICVYIIKRCQVEFYRRQLRAKKKKRKKRISTTHGR